MTGGKSIVIFKFIRGKWLFSIPLTLVLAVAVACGGAAEPAASPPTKAAEVTVPDTPQPTAMMESAATKAPVATVAPTAVVVPSSIVMEFPLVPSWAAGGKFQSIVLQQLGRNAAGEWDVHACSSLYSCNIPSSKRFNGLIEYNPVNSTEIIGDLAKSWEVNDDGTEYIFKIHDATWHDGKPVTADDIVFSLDRIADPEARRSRTAALKDFYEQGTAEALDDKTIKVPLKFPAALFLPNLATDYMKMYPRHVAEGLSPDEMQLPSTFNMGSGPWIMTDFQTKVSVEYERNPNYFKTGRPYFDGIKTTWIRDVNRIITSIQIGQAVTTEGLSPSYRRADGFQLQADTNGRVVFIPGPRVSSQNFLIYPNQPPFDDPRVRRAIFLGVDRRHVVDTIYCTEEAGCGAVVGTFFAPGLVPSENLDNIESVPGYRVPKAPDIAEAKALLVEAGYPNGFKIDANIGNQALTVSQFEVISEQLRRDFNIDITLKPVDTATYQVHMRDGTYPFSQSPMSILIADPSDTINQVYLQDINRNPNNWSDPRLDEIIKAQAVELDTDKRLALFDEAVAILRKGEGHRVPFLWRETGGLMDYRLQNFHIPTTPQIVNKWDAIWWDPNAKCPVDGGCQ